MAESPIVQTIPDNVSTDLNMDPEITGPKQKAKLDDSFNSFFAEVDAGADGTPPVQPQPEPVEAPAKTPEPKKVKAPSKKAPDVPDIEPAKADKPEPEVNAQPEAQAPLDEEAELDALPEPDHPKAKANWKRARESSKRSAAIAKAYEEQFGDLAKEYGIPLPKSVDEAKDLLPKLRSKIDEERKRPAPKDLLDELEENKQIVRKFQVATNKQFNDEYVNPVVESFKDVMEDTAGFLKSAGRIPAEVDKWLETALKDWSPEKRGFETIKTDWWQEQILNHIPDKFRQQQIFDKINRHLSLAQKLKGKQEELTTVPEKFKAFQGEQQKKYEEWFIKEQTEEAMATAKAIEDIHEWGVAKEVNGDPAKKKEIEAWNEERKPIYEKSNKAFKTWLNRMAGLADPDNPEISQPRWHARAAIEIVKGERTAEKLAAANKKMAELESKLAKQNDELNKRARIQSIPARPSSSGTVKSNPQASTKLGKSVRDAMDDYDWGDN